MFDKLIEVVQKMGKSALPFVVVNEYEGAILMRFGVYKRNLISGLRWKVPFADAVMKVDSRVQYKSTHPKTLITADGKSITVSGLCRFKMSDPKLANLSQNEYGNSAWDGMYESLSSLTKTNTYEHVVSEGFTSEFYRAVADYNTPYGIEVLSARLMDTSNAKAYRLFKE